METKDAKDPLKAFAEGLASEGPLLQLARKHGVDAAVGNVSIFSLALACQNWGFLAETCRTIPGAWQWLRANTAEGRDAYLEALTRVVEEDDINVGLAFLGFDLADFLEIGRSLDDGRCLEVLVNAMVPEHRDIPPAWDFPVDGSEALKTLQGLIDEVQFHELARWVVLSGTRFKERRTGSYDNAKRSLERFYRSCFLSDWACALLKVHVVEARGPAYLGLTPDMKLVTWRDPTRHWNKGSTAEVPPAVVPSLHAEMEEPAQRWFF